MGATVKINYFFKYFFSRELEGTHRSTNVCERHFRYLEILPEVMISSDGARC